MQLQMKKIVSFITRYDDNVYSKFQYTIKKLLSIDEQQACNEAYRMASEVGMFVGIVISIIIIILSYIIEVRYG